MSLKIRVPSSPAKPWPRLGTGRGARGARRQGDGRCPRRGSPRVRPRSAGSPVRRKRGHLADLRHNHPEPQDFRREQVNVAFLRALTMLAAPTAATSQRRRGVADRHCLATAR